MEGTFPGKAATWVREKVLIRSYIVLMYAYSEVVLLHLTNS